MALTKGINSYVNLEEANAYFADRIDVSAWTDASSTLKEQALVTASLYLNNFDWAGIAISESQTLAFPRNITYYEPILGIEKTLSEVPTRIINATYELAYHFLNNDGIFDESAKLESISVANISLTIRSMPGRLPSFIKVSINPLLKSSGSSLWWRSN